MNLVSEQIKSVRGIIMRKIRLKASTGVVMKSYRYTNVKIKKKHTLNLIIEIESQLYIDIT